jgi:chaperonin cofactor prefoldin
MWQIANRKGQGARGKGMAKGSYSVLMLTCSLQKEKEDLDDVSNELELADEDDMIPYAAIPTLLHKSR